MRCREENTGRDREKKWRLRKNRRKPKIPSAQEPISDGKEQKWTVKGTNLKWIVKWFLKYIHPVTTTWIKIENIFSAAEDALVQSPSQHTVTLWKVMILTCITMDSLYLLLNFIEMKSYCGYLCESGFLSFNISSVTFILVGAVVVQSFLWPCSSPRYEHQHLCMHPSADGRMDCFQFLIIKNKVIMKTPVSLWRTQAVTSVGYTSWDTEDADVQH